ncbi:hypothetical protein Y032_0182g903 [Ancylostoma ceylanicum]|uniref:Uncharacterized protein n=1 Tax=Ancylostoma ceylanicum TaxID=53326 RepID=A0A016SSX1_9BILA|nr:hypothetical protein Y032_0182g903 [Ancylostoma ceylanicum]
MAGIKSIFLVLFALTEVLHVEATNAPGTPTSTAAVTTTTTTTTTAAATTTTTTTTAPATTSTTAATTSTASATTSSAPATTSTATTTTVSTRKPWPKPNCGNPSLSNELRNIFLNYHNEKRWPGGVPGMWDALQSTAARFMRYLACTILVALTSTSMSIKLELFVPAVLVVSVMDKPFADGDNCKFTSLYHYLKKKMGIFCVSRERAVMSELSDKADHTPKRRGNPQMSRLKALRKVLLSFATCTTLIVS